MVCNGYKILPTQNWKLMDKGKHKVYKSGETSQFLHYNEVTCMIKRNKSNAEERRQKHLEALRRMVSIRDYKCVNM